MYLRLWCEILWLYGSAFECNFTMRGDNPLHTTYLCHTAVGHSGEGIEPHEADAQRLRIWDRDDWRALFILDMNTLGEANGISMGCESAREAWRSLSVADYKIACALEANKKVNAS